MSELPAELRSRVLASTRELASPSRRELARRRRAVLSLLVLAILAVALMRGIPATSGARPLVYLSAAASSALLIALVVSLWTLGPARSPLGRPPWSRWLIAGSVPALLAAGMLAANLIAPETLRAPRAPFGSDLLCLGVFGMLGALLLGAMVWLERGSDPVSPRSRGASLAALAGAWTAFAMALQCPSVDHIHVLATHVLPSSLLVGAGVLAGRRYIAMRVSRTTGMPRADEVAAVNTDGN